MGARTRHSPHPKGFFFHTFLKTIFLFYSHPSFACHQLQVFVCSLKISAGQVDLVSHQLLFDFISLSMRIYPAGFMKTLLPNTPLVSSSCFRPKKISKVPNKKLRVQSLIFLSSSSLFLVLFPLKLLFSSLLDAKHLPFCPFSLK